MKRFDYLRDPLFVVSLAAYAINKLLILPHFQQLLRFHLSWAWPFLHSHFDDLLLMPAALPVVLWLQRLVGLRTHDRPPGWREMFFHLAIWSVMCKVVGPGLLKIGVADPWDLLFYAGGGAAACLWWNRRSHQPSPAQP
jgi:hypothetical protein